MPSIIGAAPSQRRCLVVLTASSWALLTCWFEDLKKKTFFWAKAYLQKGTFRHDVPCNRSSPSSGLRGSSSVMFAGWGRQLRWGCRKECVRAYDCTCTCTCVCASVWLKLCCARLSQAFPAAMRLSGVKLKLGQKGFRTWVAYSLRLIKKMNLEAIML